MSKRLTVWVFQTGEPIYCDKGLHRPMRAINLTNALLEAGHRVVLWSALFNHQEKKHRTHNMGEVDAGNLVEVRLIDSPGYKKNISLARLFDHLILAKNLRISLKQEKTRPDVVFVGYPPIEAAAVMTDWLLKKDIPCLLDVKDQWPTFIIDALPRPIQGLGRILLSPLFFLAKKTMREATGVSAMAGDFLEWALAFSKRRKTNKDIVVPLTADRSRIGDHDMNNAFLWWAQQGVINDGKMRIMFVGSHYPSLDFSPIFYAASILLEKKIECDFVVCGEGELSESLRQEASNYSNVLFPGWVDRPKIESLAQMSVASIAPFRNIDCYMMSIPNKVIDALSLGLPIISPLQGEVMRMIVDDEVGLIYEDRSGKSLLKCIMELKENRIMRERITMNAANLYHRRFSYKKVYGGLVKHLEFLAGSHFV